MICKCCGKQFDEGNSYCPSCGTKLISEMYSVIIESAEAESLDVLRTVMQITNYTPVEVKMVLKNLPFTINETKVYDEALEVKNMLESAGVSVSIQNNVEKLVNVQTDYSNENKNKYQATYSTSKNQIEQQNEVIEVTEQKSEKKNPLKTLWNAIEIIIAIVVICIFIFGKPYVIGTDFLAFLNGDDHADNPYLEMVLNHRPFNDGGTYYSAFAATFDRNEWHYFKTDGKRIVQVTSYYTDINEEMITQFLVTPTEESGQFLIEPYAMRISGQNFSKTEMNIVLAAVFSGDVLEALGELIFYGNLFY